LSSYTHPDGTLVWSRNQLDPLRDEVGDEDPYLLSEGYSDPGFRYPHFGDVSDPHSGCTVDGQPWNCADIAFFFNGTTIVKSIASDSVVVPRYKEVLNPPEPPGDHCKNGICPPEPVTVHDTGTHFEIAGYDIVSSSAIMRTVSIPLTQEEIKSLRHAIEETLKDPGCRQFIKAVLNEVAADTHMELFSDDILTNFDHIGAFEYAAIPTGGYAWGSVGGGDAKIQINSGRRILPNQPFPFVDGMFGMHETAHVSTARKGQGYSDRDLGRAAYKVALAQKTEKNVPKPPDTFDTLTNSYYWNDRLFFACRPAWQR